MSGPIVRSAPSKQFTTNWDAAFGGKGASAKSKSPAKPAVKKAAKKKKKA